VLNLTNITKPIGKRNRLVSKEEAKAMLERIEVVKEKEIITPDKTIVTPKPYMNVEWEEKAHMLGPVKEVMRYKDNVERLQKRGWHRSPTPQEYYSLLINYIAGNLKENKYVAIAEDILKEGNEFTCHGFKRKENILIVYEYIGLGERVANNERVINFRNEKCFEIDSVVEGKNSVARLGDEFNEYYYTIGLSAMVRLLDTKIFLSKYYEGSEGVRRMLSHFVIHSQELFSIKGTYRAASRGVRAI